MKPIASTSATPYLDVERPAKLPLGVRFGMRLQAITFVDAVLVPHVAVMVVGWLVSGEGDEKVAETVPPLPDAPVQVGIIKQAIF